MMQRKGFLLFLFHCINIQGRLDIYFLAANIDDKVYFILTLLALAIDHSLDLHYTDIYIIAPMDKFVIQHIFHQMRTFLLPEIQFGISQSKIDGIVLLDSIEILPTFHIIPFSTIEEKGIIHPSTATFVAIATAFAVGLSSEY